MVVQLLQKYLKRTVTKPFAIGNNKFALSVFWNYESPNAL